jgi:hypothetical protein
MNQGQIPTRFPVRVLKFMPHDSVASLRGGKQAGVKRYMREQGVDVVVAMERVLGVKVGKSE